MEDKSKNLVVFFSHIGENYGVGNISKGNTHIVADIIAEETGADIFEIVPEKEYPKDNYEKCTEVAKLEKEENARPAVKGDVRVEDYDTIFIGYPVWWDDAPMCVHTFIDKHDWKGKTVIPFDTNEGSGMGDTDKEIAKSCKGAETLVGKGLAIRGTVAQNDPGSTHTLVRNWLKELGFESGQNKRK